MRLLLIAFVIAAMQSDTTALVEASKAAKAKKKTSTTKVITNADVKKSKGKLSVTPGTQPVETKPEPTLLEKQAVDRAARLALETKRAELEKSVASLEREVAALEASYYETNDLDYRDTVIAKKFAEKKAALDAARKELESVGSPVTQSPGHPAPGDRATGQPGNPQ
jgi:exonuclease VII small subunit